MSRLLVGAAALWWGSFSVIGFMVVPMLFLHLPSPAMAGGMAAKLFTAQTWLTCVCCLLLLVILRLKNAFPPVPTARVAIVFIAFGLLLALLTEFAVAPRIVARENLRLWHSAGTVMYVLQWLAATATFWLLMGPSQRLLKPPSHQV